MHLFLDMNLQIGSTRTSFRRQSFQKSPESVITSLFTLSPAEELTTTGAPHISMHLDCFPGTARQAHWEEQRNFMIPVLIWRTKTRSHSLSIKVIVAKTTTVRWKTSFTVSRSRNWMHRRWLKFGCTSLSCWMMVPLTKYFSERIKVVSLDLQNALTAAGIQRLSSENGHMAAPYSELYHHFKALSSSDLKLSEVQRDEI